MIKGNITRFKTKSIAQKPRIHLPPKIVNLPNEVELNMDFFFVNVILFIFTKSSKKYTINKILSIPFRTINDNMIEHCVKTYQNSGFKIV